MRQVTGSQEMTSNTRTVIALLAAWAGIAGCAHDPPRDEQMDRWFGKPAAELVKVWGPPKSIVKLEERRLEYRYPRPDVDASCVHFWLMNRQGFIIAHRYEGRCGS
jgi:hypothetical protein